MRLRCLIAGFDKGFEKKLETILQDLSNVSVDCVDTSLKASSYIRKEHPNLVLIRCNDEDIAYGRLFKLGQNLNIRLAIIPFISQPTPVLLKELLNNKFIVDVLTEGADQTRIQESLRKAIVRFTGEDRVSSYYRGFVGFVGVTPTLNERKIMIEANVGIVQNRSIRLAIEYWRNNPDSQIVAVSFNRDDEFSTLPDELVEIWENSDLLPWEIAVFEVQNYYSRYWREAIRDGLLPATIPTLLRKGLNGMECMVQEETMRVLNRVGDMYKKGDLQEIYHSLGLAMQTKDPFADKKQFDDFIRTLKDKMEDVDRQHPHLTRPPDETGYENFVPDKAQRDTDNGRGGMAYMDKRR